MDLEALFPVDLCDARSIDPTLLVDMVAEDYVELGAQQVARLIAAVADLDRLAAGWRPSDQDLAEAALLNNWLPAVGGGLVMAGSVHRHPSLPDGRWAFTSNVIAIDLKWRWVRTVSRVYALGRSAKFPGNIQ